MSQRKDPSTKKLTQKEMAFYVLYTRFKAKPGEWVNAWEFVGELFVKELNQWVLMSYKTPTNGLEIYFDNPGLIERQKHTGKSGARYYQYRVAPNPSPEKIKDPQLLAFYNRLKAHYKMLADNEQRVRDFDKTS